MTTTILTRLTHNYYLFYHRRLHLSLSPPTCTSVTTASIPFVLSSSFSFFSFIIIIIIIIILVFMGVPSHVFRSVSSCSSRLRPFKFGVFACSSFSFNFSIRFQVDFCFLFVFLYLLFLLMAFLFLWGCINATHLVHHPSRLRPLWGCVGLMSLPYPRLPDCPISHASYLHNTVLTRRVHIILIDHFYPCLVSAPLSTPFYVSEAL
jgi:hypothetical protein